MGNTHYSTHNLTTKQIRVKKMHFEVSVTNLTAPTAGVFVYYIHSSGEIVYDQMKLETQMQNYLDIELSIAKAEPGATCTIKIKTNKHSLVSLQGFDQSIAELGKPNEIDAFELNADKSFQNAFSDVFMISNTYEGKNTCENTRQKRFAADESDNDSRVRKNLPETWIFEDFEADENGEYTPLEVKVPDTITSFLVTGFSVHPKIGLGIAEHKKLTVFQEFFIKLYLPHSVRFGEILKVKVTVFNFISRPKQTVNADVKFFNKNGEFEFVDTTVVGGECKTEASKDQHRTKSISIPTGNGAATFFLIRALVTREIKINIRATTSNQADEVEKLMLVEHEGMTRTVNKKLLIDLRNKGQDTYIVDLAFATDKIVWNSIVIEASVTGDLLGPVLPNIHNLIKMPSGASEQQFMSWILNIAAIRYLKAVNKLTADYRANGERYLSTGYQQLSGRRNSDGSYSLWGETGDASIWLTVYVVKLLGHVRQLITINDQYIVQALNYVRARQKTDGSFPEQVHAYYYMKTKTQQGVSLTAFCAIAFLENGDFKTMYKAAIDKALKYVESKAVQMSDNFIFAISAYALALNENFDQANDFLNELKTNAISNDGKMYWNREPKSFNNVESASVNVEIAAYAIMAFVKVDRAAEALPIMNWLMTQRNSAGGFHSATDTFLALQALEMMATVFYAPNVNMEIKLSYEKNRNVFFNINSQNAMQLQYKALPTDTRDIIVRANGSGFAFLQVAYRYNIILNETARQFELTAAAVATNNPNLLSLKICTSFIPDGEIEQSQMTLIEVFLPSGYVYNPETADLVKSVGVRRVETQNRKTIVVLYFDNITTTKVCFEVRAIRQNIVTNLKASVVKIYDYNNLNNRASAFYFVSGDKPCGFQHNS